MVDPKKKGKYIGMVGALLVHTFADSCAFNQYI